MAAKAKTAPKKIGRPRQYEGDGKRPTLTFRVRGGLYERLSKEAEKSQRSLSEEIERSLEDYYARRDDYGELARLIGLAVRSVEQAQGRRYFENSDMRFRARAAIDGILDVLLCPPFDLTKAQEREIAFRHQKDQAEANPLLDAVGPTEKLVDELKQLSAAYDARGSAFGALEKDMLLPEPSKLHEGDPRRAESKFLREGPEEDE